MLSGMLPVVLILAAALALPLSLLLLRLYRRAVARAMMRRLSHEDARWEDSESHPPASRGAENLLQVAEWAPWRAVGVYAAAGFTFALLLALVTQLGDGFTVLPVRTAILTVGHAFPLMLTAILIAGSTRRAKLAIIGAYCLLFGALGAVSRGVTWSELGALWLIKNWLPGVIVAGFLARRIRAVGPLVLAFVLITLVGLEMLLMAADGQEWFAGAMAATGVAMGLGDWGSVAVIVALALLLFGPAGWLGVWWIRRRYEAKKLSDQSILLDSVWLIFTVGYAIPVVFAGGRWFAATLAAFVVYKLIIKFGFQKFAPAADEGNRRLLVLRVFSLGGPAERLFHSIALHWRYLGNVNLIAGPDLAMSVVEPHEFLDFLSGRLSRQFIDSRRSLAAKLSALDERRDRDGRFRIHDFFCHDDTWTMALAALAKRTDCVLMDLRGFSAKNKGCLHEIRELVNLVAMERVVFLVDGDGAAGLLNNTVAEAWPSMPAGSPNDGGEAGRLKIVRYSGSANDILGPLCQAAESRS